MAAQREEQEHWLAKYASNYNAWKLLTTLSGQKCFRRPLGLVETSFDTDGTYYGGRADMTAVFTLAIRHTLSKSELRRRIALAWTSLRLQHVLLMSRVEDDAETGKKCFVVDVPASKEDAVRDVERGIVWVEESYEEVDEKDLFHHALNVGRIIEPGRCMSKMHVLPLKTRADGTFELRFLIIMGHQISDGLSAYSWFSHLIRIFNTPAQDIEAQISASISQERIKQILPSAQEDLYPPIAGNRARQRWFWAIIRVLRHVKKPLPSTFANPLRREQRLEKAVAFEPKYAELFDYSEAARPPMNGGHVTASLSSAASQRLIQLCRSVNVSIGAGCFALAGLSMMEIHESRYPNVPPAARPAFTASFPLNPRAFFAKPPTADSCMLAFSEGIVMPFLPSSLPVEGRFKLVAKHANRELRVYQKRLKGKKGEGLMAGLDKHSPGRLLATGYLAQIERVHSKLPVERRTDINPQGALAPSIEQFGATCGVSSVGSVAAFFKRGTYDLSHVDEKDLVADFLDLRMGVRARDDEFLVGSSTNAEGIVGFGVSYDMNAISEEAAMTWKGKIEGLLEKGVGAKL
ncbi:Nn.00g056520.m01.CDS01 [Neocucurbitaria sp. VM-36]